MPLDGSAGEGEAEVEPVGYAETGDSDGALHTEEYTSVDGLAHLGLVHWNS